MKKSSLLPFIINKQRTLSEATRHWWWHTVMPDCTKRKKAIGDVHSRIQFCDVTKYNVSSQTKNILFKHKNRDLMHPLSEGKNIISKQDSIGLLYYVCSKLTLMFIPVPYMQIYYSITLVYNYNKHGSLSWDTSAFT